MIKKLAFLEIVVEDFDRMLAWYTEVLGLEPDGALVSNNAGRWCRLKTPTGDNRIALWQPNWKPNQDKERYSSIPVFEVDGLEAFP